MKSVSPRMILALLAALAFLPMLGQRDIVTSHEARVVQTARQMAAAGWPWNVQRVAAPIPQVLYDAHGEQHVVPRLDRPPMQVNPWLLPVLNGQLRLSKPPLPYWCVAVLFKVFRLHEGVTVPEGVARLPAALLGALATFLIYDLARLLLGRRGAWCAGLVWASSYFIPDEYRKVMADPYLAAFTLAAVWAWIRARDGAAIFVVLFYVAMALGGLAKGPVILLHVAVALGAYHACYQRRIPRPWTAHLVGAALFLAMTAPWPAYVLAHVQNALGVWRYESVGEITDNTEKARPFWFYLPGLLQIALPWTLVVAVGIAEPFVRPRTDRRRWFALAWYGGIVVAFSLLWVKKNTYLLPMMPAQVLLAARGLMTVFALARRTRLKHWTVIVAMAQAVMAWGFAAVVPFLMRPRHPADFVAGLLACVAAVLLVRPPNLKFLVRWPGVWAGRLAAAYVLALLAFFNFVVTPEQNQRSAKGVCRQIAPLLKQDGVTTWIWNWPEEASLYLPLGLKFDPLADRLLVLVDDQRGIARPDLSFFPKSFAGRPPVEVKRVELAGFEGEKERWKLFEFRLGPRDGSTFDSVDGG